MAPRLPILAGLETVLLHAGAAACLAYGLSRGKERPVPAEPLKIQLLAPALPEPTAASTKTTEENASRKPDKTLSHKKKQGPSPERPIEPREVAVSQGNAPEVSPLQNQPPSTATALEPSAQTPAQSAPPKTSVSHARYASTNRKPVYPRLSEINGEEGTVVLRVLVKADGSAGAVEIKQSSGHILLDKSASNTVRAWRFSPAAVNGKPVDDWYEVPVPFKLLED